MSSSSPEKFLAAAGVLVVVVVEVVVVVGKDSDVEEEEEEEEEVNGAGCVCVCVCRCVEVVKGVVCVSLSRSRETARESGEREGVAACVMWGRVVGVRRLVVADVWRRADESEGAISDRHVT
jgi:hypothetical protein